MQSIKVIEENNKINFESEVNYYLDIGYKISSTNCGFVNSEVYDFCSCYQAILVKEEE